MAHPSASEIDRQYRVLRMTLGIHGILRDGYVRKARFAESVLLVSSAVFCSTTFASDEFFTAFWRNPNAGRLVLGIAAVAAFATSLVLLCVDWKGASSRHAEAAGRWSDVLKLFREKRRADGTWAPEDFAALNEAYWHAARDSVEIPSTRFNSLKSKHVRQVAISELNSRHPGCPRIILATIVKVRDTKTAITDPASVKTRGVGGGPADVEHGEPENTSGSGS